MTPPIARRLLEDGRILELWPMIFNVRLTVTVPENDGICWEDAWCYADMARGLSAWAIWDGSGEPLGWQKHPASGRWRPDGTPASEINQREV